MTAWRYPPRQRPVPLRRYALAAFIAVAVCLGIIRTAVIAWDGMGEVMAQAAARAGE